MKLFHSRLCGLEGHYAMLIAILEEIEKRANSIVTREDYDDLPSQYVGYKAGGDDQLTITLDIFKLFEKTYKGYYELAAEYFSKAIRSNHKETLTDVFEIAECFDDLMRCSRRCEIDVLIRLWFYNIWQSTSNSFDDFDKPEGEECYEFSNFKHLAYTVHAVMGMMNKYFGYLANSNS